MRLLAQQTTSSTVYSKGCLQNTMLEWCFVQIIAMTFSKASCHTIQYDKFAVKI